MTETQSPIKLSELIEETQKFDVMSTFIIDEEENKVIKFNKYFDNKIVEKLAIEFFEDMQYSINNSYDFFENNDQFLKYELLLIIKHFSHFRDEIGSSFEEKIQAMEILMKIGLFDIFFDEIFDQNQVYHVIERINTIAERAVIASDEIDKVVELKGDSK